MHEATKEILYPLFDSPDRPQTFRFRKRRTTFGRSVILTIDWVLNSSDWSDGISFEEKRFLMYRGCSFCGTVQNLLAEFQLAEKSYLGDEVRTFCHFKLSIKQFVAIETRSSKVYDKNIIADPV